MPNTGDVYVKGLTANLTGVLLGLLPFVAGVWGLHACLRFCRTSANGIAATRFPESSLLPTAKARRGKVGSRSTTFFQAVSIKCTAGRKGGCNRGAWHGATHAFSIFKPCTHAPTDSKHRSLRGRACTKCTVAFPRVLGSINCACVLARWRRSGCFFNNVPRCRNDYNFRYYWRVWLLC